MNQKFKIGDLVHVKKRMKDGLIRNVKMIDGRSILKDYFVYYVEIEDSGLEWINERYLVKV